MKNSRGSRTNNSGQNYNENPNQNMNYNQNPNYNNNNYNNQNYGNNYNQNPNYNQNQNPNMNYNGQNYNYNPSPDFGSGNYNYNNGNNNGYSGYNDTQPQFSETRRSSNEQRANIDTIYLMKEVLKRFNIALIITIVAILVSMAVEIPFEIAVGGSGFTLIFAFIFGRRIKKKKVGKYTGLLYVYAGITGISLYPMIYNYTEALGGGVVIGIFASALIIFGTLSIYVVVSKKNFTFLGTALFMGLIALIVSSILCLFVQSSILMFVSSFFGIVIFSGYILYDVSRLVNQVEDITEVPAITFSLYLDFINLLIELFRIIASVSSDD